MNTCTNVFKPFMRIAEPCVWRLVDVRPSRKTHERRAPHALVSRTLFTHRRRVRFRAA